MCAENSAAIVEKVRCFPNQNQIDDEGKVKAVAGVNLPPELIYDILSRLPAKSVGRFRCVSKHYQTLLSDPQFLKLQFTRNNHQTKAILHHVSSFISIDFREDCDNNNDPIAVCETLNFQATTLRNIALRGSCNGLLLIYDHRSFELSIVNPITDESLKLPAFPDNIRRYFCSFGFGYCSNDDEYAVVMVSDHTRSSPVYMFKRSLWKRVENSPKGLYSGCGVFVNGALHWSSSWGSDHSKMIYAFDLGCERFREVEKPGGLNKEDDFVVCVLGGCLCLVVRRENFDIDFWLMKEYGVRVSWTKYIAYSSQDYRYIKPLFFWRGDESVFVEGEGSLALFGLKQETSGFIPIIREQSSELFYYDMWAFSDSLFSPNRSKAVEGPNQVKI